MTRRQRSTAPVPEEPVRLIINRRPVAAWTASPVALDALAVGRAHDLGFLRTPADLLSTDTASVRDRVYQLRVQVRADAEAAGREQLVHRREHGCGPRFLIDCRPALLPAPAAAGAPPLARFPHLFAELFDRSPSRKTTGGHHTTALSTGDGLLHLHEEVGRHNGVDKAIGAALLAGEDLRALGLVTSARISADIAAKAARAGLAWVASRSVPTTLATEIAEAGGLPLIARAAGRDARVVGQAP